MTKAQYTPGPWESEFDSDGWLHVRMPKSERFEDDWCFQCRNPTPEEHANARLIAAAPDLLEAVERIIDGMNPDAWESLDRITQEHILKAVAKAKGESI